jgi:hypothetical protein
MYCELHFQFRRAHYHLYVFVCATDIILLILRLVNRHSKIGLPNPCQLLKITELLWMTTALLQILFPPSK